MAIDEKKEKIFISAEKNSEKALKIAKIIEKRAGGRAGYEPVASLHKGHPWFPLLDKIVLVKPDPILRFY